MFTLKYSKGTITYIFYVSDDSQVSPYLISSGYGENGQAKAMVSVWSDIIRHLDSCLEELKSTLDKNIAIEQILNPNSNNDFEGSNFTEKQKNEMEDFIIKLLCTLIKEGYVKDYNKTQEDLELIKSVLYKMDKTDFLKYFQQYVTYIIPQTMLDGGKDFVINYTKENYSSAIKFLT